MPISDWVVIIKLWKRSGRKNREEENYNIVEEEKEIPEFRSNLYPPQ